MTTFFSAIALPIALFAVTVVLLLGLVTGIIPAMNAMRLNILTALGRQ